MEDQQVLERIDKILAYAKPVAEKTGTYADIVWLCEELKRRMER